MHYVLYAQMFITCLPTKQGARGGVVVKALRYKPQVAGSIPNGVIGIFQ
jgi:hypothetical protein